MKYIYFGCLCMLMQIGFAQYNEVLELLHERKIDSAHQIIETKFIGVDQKLLKARSAIYKKDLAEAFDILFNVDTLQLEPYQKAFYYDFLANTYNNNEELDEALKQFTIAKKYFKEQDLLKYYNDVNLEIYYLYLSQEPFEDKAPEVLKEYFAIAKDLNVNRQLVQAYIELAFESLDQQDLDGFEKRFDEGFKIAEKSKDSLGIAKLHSYLGLVNGEILGDLEKAEYHYDLAIDIYDTIDSNYKKKPLLLNKSNVYYKQEKYDQAIQLLKEAEQQPTANHDDGVSVFIYRQLSEAYEKVGEIDSALTYNKKLIALNQKINENQQFINISRFEAEKKENENILLQQKNERNRYLLLFLGISLIALILVIYLINSNAKRKQLLLDKKRELAEQKNKSLLKEQELKSIDAMLEGQEKERQRMASDLHDNIGASLTSVKMHFNHIKQQIQKNQFDADMFQKTDSLLETTYQEIRNLAHLKNAGVLAKDGLVPALKKLVEKSSNQTHFKIELSIHDLDKRLSNSLEIGIFRIVQELITNIIKHAKATKVSISITNHGDLINIIVEDDGIGFSINEAKKTGMGLESIQRKISQFNGEIDIDSQKGKGTTIIIDLPL